jgi:hypothetical protein
MGATMARPDNDGDFPGAVRGVPGAEYFSAVSEIWTRWFTESASAYSKVWEQVQSGNFAPGDLLKSTSRLWQDQYRAVQDLVRAPLQDSATWHYFQFDKSASNALVDRVPLSKRQDSSAEIKATPLHILGPGPASIVGALDASWADDRGSIEIRFDPDKLKVNPTGEYIGFIYNEATSSGPPLVIILLKIV